MQIPLTFIPPRREKQPLPHSQTPYSPQLGSISPYRKAVQPAIDYSLKYTSRSHKTETLITLAEAKTNIPTKENLGFTALG